MIDFDQINTNALAAFEALLREWLPGGRREGNEYVSRNPTRSDSNPGSFKVNVETGVWSDFATDDNGSDPISLWAYLHGLKQAEAAREVESQVGARPTQSGRRKRPAAGKESWVQVVPIPAEAIDKVPQEFPKKIDGKWVQHPVVGRWPYNGPDGLLGYDCRIETPAGKDVLPLTYRQQGNKRRWRWQAFDEPRPLYNLARLISSPDERVIGVEGCKCASALQDLLDDQRVRATVTTWPGGCKAVGKADWSVLKGRHVIYWPDADKQKYPEGHRKAGIVKAKDQQPGYKAALRIAKLCYDAGVASFLIVDPPMDKNKGGWDVADAIDDGMTAHEILQFMGDRSVPPPDNLPPAKQAELFDDAPFRCLGYNGDFHYYLPRGTRQVKAIKGESHQSSTLLTIAPLWFWAKRFPGKRNPNWMRAADLLLRRSEARGVFNHMNRRGRGAWYDRGRSVLHLGHKLIVDGKTCELERIDSTYVYEAGTIIEDVGHEPLTAAESKPLREITESLFWENPLSALYLAGWCMLAPVCGALEWRPHIWITGPSGSGKSYVMERIVLPCLGPYAVQFKSSSTAAGMRQMLGCDSLPIPHDESEAEDKAGQQRIQEELELMRAASSDSDARIVKGSQSGRANTFYIRSMFCLASIGVALTQQADVSRVTVLTLEVPHHLTRKGRASHFEGLNNQVTTTINERWCAGLRARAVKMIPVIRENANTFAIVAAESLGARRAGDQIGTLLAGAYAVEHDGKVRVENARKWFEAQEWSEAEALRDYSDERRCLSAILEHTVRVAPSLERSVDELLDICHRPPKTAAELFTEGGSDDAIPTLSYDVADACLRRVGIRYTADDDRVWISDSHSAIRRILDKTPWPTTWGRLLKRVPNAVSKRSMRFFGNPTRATGIPWNEIFPDEDG